MKKLSGFLLVPVILLCAVELVSGHDVFTEPLTLERAAELAAHRGNAIINSAADQKKLGNASVGLSLQGVGGSGANYLQAPSLTRNVGSDDTDQQAVEVSAQSSFGHADLAECLNEPAAQDQNELLITAISYSRLVWVNLHLQVLKQQQQTALRLVNVEKLRVSTGVDADDTLIRARLLEAQARMRISTLEREALDLRKDLAGLTGVPEDQIDLVPESIPSAPDEYPVNLDLVERMVGPSCRTELVKLDEKVKELRATRDAAQLSYSLAKREAIRSEGLGTETLGTQLSRRVRCDEKYGILIDAASELQVARFELLNANGELTRHLNISDPRPPGKMLASAELSKEVIKPGKTPSRPASHIPSPSNAVVLVTGEQFSVKALLILPSENKLTVREYRQLAAVAMDDRGGHDVTSLATWSSSNESVAIVSTSGLITGFRTGQATITATLSGVSRSKAVTISTEKSIP